MQVEIVEDPAARERRDARLTTAWMLAIAAAAAVLRFWALGAGIPYSLGTDEPQVMNRVDGMLRSGDYNPRFFDYPGFYIYLQLAVACVRFMYGALVGHWSSLGEAHMADFMLWGRAMTAALGTATVVLLYWIGLRWGRRQALLAAGLLAVMPLHVRESHFVLTDVPVAFFVTLAFLLTLRAVEVPSMARFALAGAAAGAAAATKYPGALALMMPVVAIAMTADVRARTASLLATVAASGAAFLVLAPYTLLDLPGFLDGYARLMSSYAGASTGAPEWQTYLTHLRRGMGGPAFLAAVVGAIVGAFRVTQRSERLKWTLAVGFALLYFWFVSRQTLVFGRYLMPMIPFAMLLAAVGVVWVARMLRRLAMPRRVCNAVVAALTIVVLAPPAIQAISFDANHARRGTPALAHEWLSTQVRPGSLIAWEGTDLSLTYAAYNARHFHQLRHRPHRYFRENGVDYVIASSQRFGGPLADPQGDPEGFAYYSRLFAENQEVARFTPSAAHPGPELRILKVAR